MPTATATADRNADSNGDGCRDARGKRRQARLYRGSRPLQLLGLLRCARSPRTVNPAATRNRAVGIADALAMHYCVGTSNDGPPNGADCDSDVNGDTTDDGLVRDRSPSGELNLPWEAGPPSGTVNMTDVLAVLAQVGLHCSGAP